MSVTAEHLARALLEVAAAAGWPAGWLLYPDDEVLGERLAPRLLAALNESRPTSEGDDAATYPLLPAQLPEIRPQPTAPNALQEHAC